MNLLAPTLLLLPSTLIAQIGGTGKDGVFDPQVSGTIPTTYIPEFHFKSVRIRKGITMTAVGSRPLVIRCQGTVQIDGELLADGSITPGGTQPGKGGPGGYDGGLGSNPSLSAMTGKGPCGGAGAVPSGWGQTTFPGGQGLNAGCSGSQFPFSMTGGSGGGGGNDKYWTYPSGGSGGGGVIVILADGAVQIGGLISASGAPSRSIHVFPNPPVVVTIGGRGAGGSILMRSMTSIQTGPSSLILAEGSTQYPATSLYQPIDRWKPLPFWGRSTNVGYIRFDVVGGTPILNGVVFPKPSIYSLPAQDIPQGPVLGKTWSIRVAGRQGDLAAIFWSWGLKRVNAPPFGTLELDLSNGFILAGALAIPSTGLDPVGVASFYSGQDTTLIGRALHAQSLTLGLTGAKPRLTNVSSTKFQ